jgi:hypothetical protein
MPFDGSSFSTIADQAAGSAGPDPSAARPNWRQRLRALLAPEGWGADIHGFVPGSRSPVAEPTVGEVLILARRLIEHEDRWIKGHYATLDGRHCAVGALRAAALRLDARRIGRSAQDHLRDLSRARGFRSIEQMNDHSSHAEVLDVFDTAIRSAENRAA